MFLNFSRSVELLALSFLFLSLSEFQAQARWAEKKEANIAYLKGKRICKVHKDGSWTMESEFQLKALNEAGRQTLSTQSFTYDATLSTFEVVAAKTNDNGKEIIVPKEKIEDKPLASDPMGLREERQILVPFECVTDNATISLKIKQHFFNPQFERYFYQSLRFGGYLWEEDQITIESELPLFLKVNDPRNSLKITENKDKSKYTLHVELKKPIYEALVGESKYSYGESDAYTSVCVSTEKDYERLGKLAAKFYQPILTAPLPEYLETTRTLASKSKDEVDCINTIVTRLIEKISYLGSWNTAEGHLTPRSLEAIIKSGYGDCKEYSSCLAAVLNRLGYQAKIVLVERGEIYLEDGALPGFQQFNHAIVKVISPSGKIYWIDPTNNVSMADGIFPDIANRPVVVLDAENPTYERIPPINYQHSKSIIERTITIDEGHVKTEGSYYEEGESAKDLAECLNMQQSSLVKEALLKGMCEGGDPLNATLNLPEPGARKVKPLKTTFNYEENHIMVHTNFGDAFPLSGNWYKPYVATSKKDEGALYVGPPQTLVKRSIFKNVSAQNLEKLAFSIQTPWLNVKRELVANKEGVVVIETIERLESIISAKDLKSEGFEKLKNTLRKYCDGVAIIFEK